MNSLTNCLNSITKCFRIFDPIKKFFKQLPSFTDIKSNEVALKRLGFNVIASGSEKYVVEMKNLGPSHGSGNIFYVPIRTFFYSREKALRKEREKMKEIKETCDAEHLAVESKETKVGNFYALEVEKANRDMEGAIRDRTVETEERVRLSTGFIKGLAAMHKGGYVYGDIKAENALVYEKEGKTESKISDFGKAEKMGGKESKTYKGNLRYAPPEGKLSQKSDVYGAAIVLIRTFEEPYLQNDGDPLLPVDKKDLESERAIPKKSRGVERYIVDHKAFLGMNAKSLLLKLFKRMTRQRKLGNLPDKQVVQQRDCLEKYVGVLIENMKNNNNITIPDTQVDEFGTLLLDMLKLKSEERPIMEEVSTRYSKIWAQKA